MDIRDKKNVLHIIKKINPHYVVHLASAKCRLNELDSYRQTYETNVIGSINLVQSCLKLNDLRKFIFLGSCDEYGSHSIPFFEYQKEIPNNVYGHSKLATTKLLQILNKTKQFPSVILRPSVIYGPYQKTDMFLSSLIYALINKKNFAMSLGEQTRDFIYIDDVVYSIIKTLESNDIINGKIINISSGKPVKIKNLAIKVAQLVGQNSFKLIDFGAIGYRESETMEYWADNQSAKELINWSPLFPLGKGLKKTIKYFAIEKNN